MQIYFGKKLSKESVPQVIIDKNEIERVNTFKLLGVIISSDVSWWLLQKISKRCYVIFQLTRIGIAVVIIYCAIILNVLEYAYAV